MQIKAGDFYKKPRLFYLDKELIFTFGTYVCSHVLYFDWGFIHLEIKEAIFRKWILPPCLISYGNEYSPG